METIHYHSVRHNFLRHDKERLVKCLTRKHQYFYNSNYNTIPERTRYKKPSLFCNHNLPNEINTTEVTYTTLYSKSQCYNFFEPNISIDINFIIQVTYKYYQQNSILKLFINGKFVSLTLSKSNLSLDSFELNWGGVYFYFKEYDGNTYKLKVSLIRIICSDILTIFPWPGCHSFIVSEYNNKYKDLILNAAIISNSQIYFLYYSNYCHMTVIARYKKTTTPFLYKADKYCCTLPFTRVKECYITETNDAYVILKNNKIGYNVVQLNENILTVKTIKFSKTTFNTDLYFYNNIFYLLFYNTNTFTAYTCTNINTLNFERTMDLKSQYTYTGHWYAFEGIFLAYFKKPRTLKTPERYMVKQISRTDENEKLFVCLLIDRHMNKERIYNVPNENVIYKDIIMLLMGYNGNEDDDDEGENNENEVVNNNNEILENACDYFDYYKKMNF